MDNCSLHVTLAVIELLSTARLRVVVITFAPHAMEIFQVLDLALFGVLKPRPRYQLPLEDDAGSIRFIKMMYHDHDFRMTMTMIEPNSWGAFGGLGVNYSVVDGVQRASFDDMSLCESESLKELWDIDFRLAKLSPRRQMCTFSSINEPESNGMVPSSSKFIEEDARQSDSRQSEKVAFWSDSAHICVYSWNFYCYHF
jgi:hypothetical protein